MSQKKKTREVYPHVKRLFSAVAIIAFIVLGLGGFRAGVRPITIIYRSLAVVFGILIINAVVIRVLKGYEEITSGKT